MRWEVEVYRHKGLGFPTATTSRNTGYPIRFKYFRGAEHDEVMLITIFFLPSFICPIFGISLGFSSHEVLGRMMDTTRGLRSTWIMGRMMSGWKVSQMSLFLSFVLFEYFFSHPLTHSLTLTIIILSVWPS